MSHHATTGDKRAVAERVRVSVLGTERVLERLVGGTRSEVYRCGDHVIRVSGRTDAAIRFENEKRALDLVGGEAEVLVPTPIATGASDGLAWQVTTYIPGEAASSAWPGLSARARDALARTAGRQLARLHAIGCATFGYLVDPEGVTEHTWLGARLSEAADLASSRKRFSTSEIDDVCGRIRAEWSSYPETVGPCLCHGDFHFENVVLTPSGTIAFVDFEWAGGGRGIADLAKSDYQEAVASGSTAPMQVEYARAIGIARDDLHCMIATERLLWKFTQAATRENDRKALENKAELFGLMRA